MRIVSISRYNHQTMQLAKPVFDRFRRVLLAAGNTVHPKYLDKMKEIGIRALFVEDAESRGITMEELMDMPTWMDIIEVLTETFTAAKARKPLPVLKLNAAAGKLITEIRHRPLVLPIHSNSMPDEYQPQAHAVNVALLALQVGKQLGYNDLMLRDLALGCLLHDIGKCTVGETDKHPEEGFNIIRTNRELSLMAAHCAFQHHERHEGGGLPRGIGGAAFHEFAQICGLCSLFENRFSDRNWSSQEVLEYIMTLSGTAYAPHIVEQFVRTVPAYPPGAMVEMHNGRQAIVVKITSHMQRPVVRFTDNGEELPLAEHPSVVIKRSIAI